MRKDDTVNLKGIFATANASWEILGGPDTERYRYQGLLLRE
jgi:hypothetical protein